MDEKSQDITAAEGLADLMVPIDQVRPHARNPRVDHDVKAIAASIRELGWHAPLVARRDGTLLIGHGRLAAAKLLGLSQVPVVRVGVGDEQAVLRMIADNRLGDLSRFDLEALKSLEIELPETGDLVGSLDLNGLVNLDPGPSTEGGGEGDDDRYTKKVEAPIYKPTGKVHAPAELYDCSKANDLIEQVQAAGLPEDVAEFLVHAARRHTVFDYHRIADFYALASPEVQDLMERSALVIIDFNKAIEYGFVRLTEEIAAQYGRDYPDEA